MLLQALVACAGVTLSAVATALEVELRGGMRTAEGDLDFRRTLGVDREAPVDQPAATSILRSALTVDHPHWTERARRRRPPPPAAARRP